MTMGHTGAALLVLSLVWAGAAGQACPACDCESSTEVPGALIINCNFRGLTEVPTFRPSTHSYHALTMVGNRIAALNADAFAGIVIEKLDLSQNNIRTIDSMAFSGQEDNLKQLILHTDRMSTFPTAAVNRLTGLEKLTLAGFNTPDLPSQPLRELTRLQELTVTDSNLARLQADALAAQANTLSVLDLHQNQLSAVPNAALRPLSLLRELDLHENQISGLTGESFTGVSLVTLDLSQNAISSMTTGAFSPLAARLEQLNMRSTNLVDSRLAALRELVQLRRLIIDYNNVDNIPTNLLDNMKRLEQFSAQSNNINRITYQMFQGAGPTLRYLNLEDNRIYGPNSVDDPFGGLDVLEELYLNGQAIAGLLTADTLRQQAGTLLTLSLSNTGFTDGDWPKVNYLTALRTLQLTGNAVSSLPDMNFLQMSSLQHLYMDSNALTSLNQKSLFGTQNSLNIISLDSNSIATLGHCTLFMFDINIYNISLSGNPLVCDCRLKWLREKYEYERIPDLDFLLDWTCEEPANLRGRLFREVPVSDFLCSAPVTLPPCQDITPTTTTTTTTVIPPTGPTPGPGTTERPEPIAMNITDVTDTSLVVRWTVAGVPNLTGFLIKYFVLGSGTTPQEQYESRHARQSLVQGLLADTDYVVCVALMLQQGAAWPYGEEICDNTRTDEQGLPVGPPPNVGVIIGAAVGGIVLILLVILLAVFLVRRSRRKAAEAGGARTGAANMRDVPFSFGMNGTPRLGADTQRFSKPRGAEGKQNYKNEGLSDSTDGFSVEERNRIIDWFQHNRGSTLSVVSAGSRDRYVPEPRRQPAPRGTGKPPSLPPRPQDLEGYLNPVMLRESSPSVYPDYSPEQPHYLGGQPPYQGGQSNYQDGQPPYQGGQPHYQGGQPPYQGGPPGYHPEGLQSPGVNPGAYAPMDGHLYSEIPADGAYEEIPAGVLQTDSFV